MDNRSRGGKTDIGGSSKGTPHCFPNPNTSFASLTGKGTPCFSRFSYSKTSVLSEQSTKSTLNTEESKKSGKSKCSYDISTESSNTKYIRRVPMTREYETITKAEYFCERLTVTTEESYGCRKSIDSDIERTGRGEKIRFKKLVKKFDALPKDETLGKDCPILSEMSCDDILSLLVRFIKDGDVEPVFRNSRISEFCEAYCQLSKHGFCIRRLDDTVIIIDYLLERFRGNPTFDGYLMCLLANASQPIRLKLSSDIINYFDQLQNYFIFFCYILYFPEDKKFYAVADAWISQLSMCNKVRGKNAVKKGYIHEACEPDCYYSLVRGAGVVSSNRFPYIIRILLLIADRSEKQCLGLVQEKILDSLFIRFNPYFPFKELPFYETGPDKPMDNSVHLGDSTKNGIVMSLLLVLLTRVTKYLKANPEFCEELNVPNKFSQRSFIWGYRYECRARDHSRQRNCLTAILMLLVDCYGNKLTEIYNILMPDLVSLAVLNEIPPRNDWTASVNINTSRDHVIFKRYLIQLCVLMMQKEPDSRSAIEQRHWLIGLMYILDPNLNDLNPNWSSTILAELRKLSLQALLATIKYMRPEFVLKCGLIRRLLWYIEWYTVSPYDLSHLYWTIRLLQKAMFQRHTESRAHSIYELFSTHGIIIFMNLCEYLMDMESPPIEKCQIVLAMAVNLMTKAAENQRRVKCTVYPHLVWPISVNSLAKRMLNNVVQYMEQDIYVNERWLISIFNFIWALIVWKKDYRDVYISNNNIYKLLDAVVLMRAPLQCLALAVICDLTQSGNAIGQLITWRYKGRGTPGIPKLFKRSGNIATLFAAIVQDELTKNEVEFDEDDTIFENNPIPIMSKTNTENLQSNPHYLQGKSQRTSVCLAASELAGSRMSKVYALLAMITDDFARKVQLTDESYNMYRTATFSTQEEMILMLTSHFLTLKLNEAWTENFKECKNALYTDLETVFDFMNMATGWARYIKHEQIAIIKKDHKKELNKQMDFYSLLKRICQVNALEGLRTMHQTAASSDRSILNRSLIHDAIHVHHKRINLGRILNEPIIQTFVPFLDSSNVLGQNTWINSIFPKVYHMGAMSSCSTSYCGSTGQEQEGIEDEG